MSNGNLSQEGQGPPEPGSDEEDEGGGGFGSAIAAGGLALLGSLFSGFASSKSARRQMDFQEAMSRTAHQREVEDLRLAGLNPILSATGGAGASTPSGASVRFDDVAQGAVNTALAARRQREEILNLAEQRRSMVVQQDLNAAQAGNQRAQAALTTASTPIPAAVGDTVKTLRDWLTRRQDPGESGPTALADRLREATPGLEPARGFTTDVLEAIRNSAQRVQEMPGELGRQFLQFRDFMRRRRAEQDRSRQ